MNPPIPTPRYLFALFGALAMTGLAASTMAAPAPAALPTFTPSAAETTQINEGLKKLVEQADPSTKATFDKYPQFSMVARNSAAVPTENVANDARHAGFVEVAKKGDIDLLFDGDSITDFWWETRPQTNKVGRPVFDKYFGNLKVANFAISGDTTQGVLWRLQNGEGQGFSPKGIMLMIGTNNASNGRNTAPEIADGVAAIVAEMRKDFPDARILLLAIFPRSTPDSLERKTNTAANALIAKLDDHEHIFFYDIGAKFLDANGIIQPDIMADMTNGQPTPLHPTTKGYEIWAEAVKDPIANMMKGLPPFAATPAK